MGEFDDETGNDIWYGDNQTSYQDTGPLNADDMGDGFDNSKIVEIGFSEGTGIHKITGTKYDQRGYDVRGYDKDGFHWVGFDKNGIHKITGTKYDQRGYDVRGYDKAGYDRDGFDKAGYDKAGYDRDGNQNDGFDEGLEWK